MLAPQARLRVVYFNGGRQETYVGPARFTVGRTASRQEAGAAAQVAVLAGRNSHVDERELAAARETYDRLRAAAAADDILLELYLYAVLREAQRNDEFGAVVAEMQRRRPSDEAVRLLRR